MSLLAASHIFVGSICLVVSLLHLAVFLRRTELKVHLIFALMALCSAVATVLDIGMHQARDVADFAVFLKSSNTFQALLWIAFAWFIWFYTGNNRRWAVLLVSGLYLLALFLNLAFPYGILFEHIDRLDIVSLPWGELIAFGIGPANPWRILPDVAWFLLLAYALDSCIHMGRRGQRRRAIFFGVSLFACLGIGYLHGTLIDLGLLPPPSVWVFTFLALIVLMSGSILNQVVQVPVLKRQLLSQKDKAQRDIADEKARMDIILSSLNTFLVLLDSEFNVVWVNELTRKTFPADDLVGKKCYLMAEYRSEPCEGCGAVAAFSDGRVNETERLNSLNNRWYHIVSVPIKDESGRVVNVLESSTDITERKLTETARDSAMKELESLKAKLEEENIYLRRELQNQSGFDEIIGESNSLLYVLTRVKQVAETDATVLVQGETGVGKELVAKAIHQSSRRADKPFVKLNCAALPTNLVESELFGHEKGAFTGADQTRKGRFELADGGSLLLDEISELPLETQAKLLRVLQEGQFERVGGSRTLSVDVRIIATTNRKLKDDIIKGQFRSDLFYRLNVYPLTVPPLRDRLADIPLLVQYFVTQIAGGMGKTIDQVPPHVITRLQQYDWPGNVRELRNVLEQAVIHSPDHILQLPKGFADFPSEAAPLNSPNGFGSLESVEKQHILKVLEATGWRISGPNGAATILEINPSTLRFRIKKLGISKSH